jgi:hypothetical protein
MFNFTFWAGRQVLAMNKVELLLCRCFLPRLLARGCKLTVPRSGKDGEDVNCFSVSIEKQGEPYLLVRSITNDVLDCLEWDSQSQRCSIAREIPLTKVHLASISVRHYYGLSEVRYSGIFEVAIGLIFRLEYFKIHVVRSISGFDQYFFNKKKLITKRRIDLLRFMLEQRTEGTTTFRAIDLMTKLYSIKWVSHPDSNSQLELLEFYLESLLQTGELSMVNKQTNLHQTYQLTGYGLGAIVEYEEQERRHTENVKAQRGILWLTILVTIFTAAQAGLIKFPVLFDLSGESAEKPAQPGGIIYIQIDKADHSAAGNELAQELRQSSFNVKSIEKIQSAQIPKISQVRYSSEGDRAKAEQIQAILKKKRHDAIIQFFAPAPTGQLEVWLTKN